MPCRVDGPLTPAEEELQHYTAKHTKELREENEKLTRMLCEYDRVINKIFEKEELSVKPSFSKELSEWLKQHRISDTKRREKAMVDFEALAKKLGYNLKKIEIE